MDKFQEEYTRLLEQKEALEIRVRKGEQRRRAFIHILSDLNTVNRKLNDQRKAMIHILADYEKDRNHLTQLKSLLTDSVSLPPIRFHKLTVPFAKS